MFVAISNLRKNLIKNKIKSKCQKLKIVSVYWARWVFEFNPMNIQWDVSAITNLIRLKYHKFNYVIIHFWLQDVTVAILIYFMC